MREIEGFNRYLVSEDGKIFNKRLNKYMKQHAHRCGYMRLLLTNDEGKKQQILPHRAVALAYVENNENKPQVNHIDGIKTNNHYTNLEWVTAKENTAHAIMIGNWPEYKPKGFVKNPIDQTGEKNRRAKLKEKDILYIRKMKGEVMQKELAKRYNVSVSLISNIQKGKIWMHLKYDESKVGAKFRSGEYSEKAKLNDVKIRIIRRCLQIGMTQKEIAKIFNVVQTTISKVKSNKTYKTI